MWLRRVIGLSAIGVGCGMLVVLFLPITVIFFLVAIALLVLGYCWLFN